MSPEAIATATTTETPTGFHSSGAAPSTTSPLKHNIHSKVETDYEDSSEQDSEEEDDGQFSLCDYDLDVVDEALMNPNSNEYRDHFGFRIQVKTDDEDDDDSSVDSGSDSDDNNDASPVTLKKNQSSTTTTTKNHHSPSSTTSSDTDYSVDTAMTTPTTIKHPPPPPPPLEIEHQQPAVATTARRARGRAATISKPNTFTLPQQQESPVTLSSSGSEGKPMTATTGRRRRATTLSRPQPPPMPFMPATITTTTTRTKAFETVGEEDEQQVTKGTTVSQEQPLVAIPQQPQQDGSITTTVEDPQQRFEVQPTIEEKQKTTVDYQQPIIQESNNPSAHYHAMGMGEHQLQHTSPFTSEEQSITESPLLNEKEKMTMYHTVDENMIPEQLSKKELVESPKSHVMEEEEEEKKKDGYEEQEELQGIKQQTRGKELPPLPTTNNNNSSNGSIPTAISKPAMSGSTTPSTSDHESIRSTTSSEYQNGNNRSRSDSVGAKSFASSSFNPFKRAGSPTSIRTGTRAVERPSTAYRERQSKRMSEFYRFQSQPSSPSSTFQGNNRLSYASASSYYDMLMSKFGRSSEEHPPIHSSSLMRDSPKQIALKEEAKQHLEDLKATDSEQDYDFWEAFIQDTDDMMRSQADSVKHHMVAGIPTSLRGYIWQIMSKSRNNGELESEYRELLKRISPHEKSIQRDLARTFPTHEFFKDSDGEGQEALFNVTKAYSLFDQQVGYCQGLPFIVGGLLLHMPDDMAFCVLIKLMSQYGLRGQFMPQMELLHERLYQFEHILQQKLPQIHKHLEVQGVQPSMYASQWFLTLFASKCPLHLAFRVFDMVLLEGSHVVLRFALALMFRNQHTLLNLEFEALVDFLNNAVFDTYKDDESGFVHDAYSMDVPSRLLTRLAKQHANEAAREAKSQNQEEHLRRINTELSSHVRRLEKSYRNLEHEHQEVTKQVIDAKMTVARMEDESQQLRWQLSQAKTELEQLKTSMPAVEEIQRQNKQLSQKNGHLESQLEDVEAILISLKMNIAERESAYEEMRQKLHKAGIQ